VFCVRLPPYLQISVAEISSFAQVKNEFKVAGEGKGGPAVKDEMMVSLRDVKVTHCRLAEDMQQSNETVLLEPVTLIVEVSDRSCCCSPRSCRFFNT